MANKRTMTLNLTDAEMNALEELSARKDLSKTAVLRQALRLYQVVDARIERGEKLFFEDEAKKEKAAKEKAEFEAVAERIRGLRFIAPRKVGENDVLYGSVTSGDIGEFLAGKGIEIDKRKVQLDEPVKHLGEHEVKIKLHPEVTANLKLLVTKEG